MRVLSIRGLRKPFHIDNSIAQPEDGRDEAREPVAGQKCMVTEPSPADALGQDVAGLLLPLRGLQPNLVDSLESGAAPAGREILQASVELLYAAAGDQTCAAEVPSLKVLRQTAFHYFWGQQPILVPLLGFQRHHEIIGERSEPIPLRRMSRRQDSESVADKPRLASNVARKENCAGCVRRIVHDHNHISLLCVAFELRTFPTARPLIWLYSQRGYRPIAFDLQKCPQQRSKIGTGRAQSQEQDWLRAEGAARYKALSEGQDVEVCQIKSAEWGWNTDVLGPQIGR